ncbi:MAG: biotin--[acetyl-CoA-carboxylase] ligase [Spirochaetales bacterium]|nr:biotin--[acetyl-CoA-carboxylase] ligase [Spirochaetales bacterium]
MKQDKEQYNYTECTINNPFESAPVYYVQSTTSTMDDARLLTQNGAVHGTVVCTGYQAKGRGRSSEREWISAPGENLLFTLVLKKNALTFLFPCLPVMTGLVICLVCEEQFGFSPSIKWPNDILFKGKKLAGILCEADNDTILCGIGINCNQVCFPDYLEKKATSFCIITGKKTDILGLCESILSMMKRVFSRIDSGGGSYWQAETEKRLYRKGDTIRICFPGNDKKNTIPLQGALYGIDPDGALLVLEQGAATPVRVIAGEIEFI